jgi:hypothetical protein
MKKILVTSLGIAVIFLFVLSSFNAEVISKPAAAEYCWTLKPGGPEPCWDEPTNCFCPIIITPNGGAQ